MGSPVGPPDAFKATRYHVLHTIHSIFYILHLYYDVPCEGLLIFGNSQVPSARPALPAAPRLCTGILRSSQVDPRSGPESGVPLGEGYLEYVK